MKKVHRFIGPYDLRDSEIVLEDDNARQIALVLKMEAGEHVVLCDGEDHEAEFEILEVMKKSVRLERKHEPRQTHRESENAVTLYLSILKRENFELVVQKATECGVTKIVPVLSERTIKKDVKLERLQEIAKEAAEQSGRGLVPEISEPMDLEDALHEAEGKKYFFDFDGQTFGAPNEERVSLFIGPEGGWTDEEREMAKRADCVIATLGPRVLRGETAAIVAVFLATG